MKKIKEQDQEILNYLIKYQNRIPLISARQIARELNINPMTITRFIKKHNYQSYNEFKYHFPNFIQKFIKQEIKENDLLVNKIESMSLIEKNTIDETKKLLDLKELEKIITVLENHLYIDIIATDTNSELAKFSSHYLANVAKIVSVYDTSDKQAILPKIIPSNHVVIIMSKQQKNEYIYNFALELKNRGITSILISGKGKDKLNKLCTYVLKTAYEVNNTILDDFIYHISSKYIFDLMFYILYTKNLQKSREIEKQHNTIYQKVSNKI